MSNSMISKHSKSAFDESESITILKGLLESTREIKTFFGENDRTPNYDGTFELINQEGEPVKQFIVQIKKEKILENMIIRLKQIFCSMSKIRLPSVLQFISL